jgi:myo-inositol 2-dehydrogenase/D-chiro-inositol 1-dehydrogenase
MITFAMFGAGRIGKIHAGNVASAEGAKLAYIVDVDQAAMDNIAKVTGAKPATREQVFADKSVDAVVICSPTDTHADLCIAAAKAGKAIFCEKPIDLSLKRVDTCLAAIRRAGVPMMVGFNRRFDPSFAALKTRLDKGEIGTLEQLIITSRDPGLAPLEYLKVSGGQFRDMTIHDFDMARWLLGEDPSEVYATGSCLVDPGLAKINDIDSCMVVMRTATGKLAHINNSRRASYGYDQRVEMFGSKGRLRAENVMPTTVELANGEGVSIDKPLHFFLERYALAYRIELAAFLNALAKRRPMPISAGDGRSALVLAEAAIASLKSGRAVKPKF